MPELNELEDQLAALRREITELQRVGCTPNQALKLMRDIVAVWAAIEKRKVEQQPALTEAQLR